MLEPEAEYLWPPDEELAGRLRDLRWPQPSPQAKTRAWAWLASQVEALFPGSQARSA